MSWAMAAKKRKAARAATGDMSDSDTATIGASDADAESGTETEDLDEHSKDSNRNMSSYLLCCVKLEQITVSFPTC